MPIPNEDDVTAVETNPFVIEASGVSIEEKVDHLIGTAAAVKIALDRRTFVVVIAIIVPLVVGAFLIWRQNTITDESRKVAKLAYVQSLVNNRDFLQYRHDFAQTRDCPVNYFRALLEVSRDRGDLSAVIPPCSPVNLPDIDARIAEVEKKIALAQK